ncbi:MAG TPA: hypothetical protein VMV49_13110 [Candidatus Deferrimicrobium sp.]|nr:hypothetical protein [Candidatus Deferrimicrobium sp.]
MQGISLYNVTDEGELTELAISGPIKDLLNSEMVVLLVLDAQKMIYLWKGVNARVRRKFIAARVSQDLRGQKGLSFKVDSIDQGDEPNEFIQAVGGPIPMDTVPELSSMEAAPATAPAFATSQPSYSPQIMEPAPMPSVAISQPTGGVQVQLPGNIEEGVKAIINEIEKHPPPSPYQRELVFIGPYAFSIAETRKTAFGDEHTQRRWELASPPEGQFLAKGYTPRAIIKSGKVLAVELLKGGEADAAGAGPDTPIEIFKIKFQK